VLKAVRTFALYRQVITKNSEIRIAMVNVF
jgi:hypothetical protein